MEKNVTDKPIVKVEPTPAPKEVSQIKPLEDIQIVKIESGLAAMRSSKPEVQGYGKTENEARKNLLKAERDASRQDAERDKGRDGRKA